MQQVLSSELPRKRPWSSVAQLFVQRQTQTDRVQSREIVRREHLPLDDRKVNLHLVQPTRMHGRVDQDDPFVAPTHPLHRRLTTMRRTIYPRHKTTAPHRGKAPAPKPDPPVGQTAGSPSSPRNAPELSPDVRPMLPGT